MVIHQHPGEKPPSVPYYYTIEQLKPLLAVAVIADQNTTFPASGRHMVNAVFKVNPQGSRDGPASSPR